MTVSEHVWIGGGGLRDGGVGGSYQPGVYVPLKALFLVATEIRKTLSQVFKIIFTAMGIA